MKRYWSSTSPGGEAPVPPWSRSRLIASGRFYAALDPEEFSRCFTRWVQAIGEETEGEVVAVGGKTLRRSFDRASSKAAIHMVSAWASKTGLVLGQVKTDEESNEIPAIPRLLEILRLEGCIVTIDAIGAQKGMVKTSSTRERTTSSA